MITYRSHLIAREGWCVIAVMALLGLILHVSIGFVVAIPFWIITLMLCILFRDPKRAVPPKPLAIVSPVDGRVSRIDTLKDPFTALPMVQIELRKGYFDVMAARSPMEGKILKQWLGAVDVKGLVGQSSSIAVNGEQHKLQGCDINADTEAHLDLPAPECRFAQWILSDEQDNVVMTVKSATSIYKPRCYSRSGDRIGQGQRCGFIPFAADVQVNVPESSRIEVKIGDIVKSGSDTLATLVH